LCGAKTLHGAGSGSEDLLVRGFAGPGAHGLWLGQNN
jgi:hypothetical protein